MILAGFIDDYPKLKLIASHGGATLPYIAGRLDICHANMPAARVNISAPPSSYLKKIYYDTVVFTQEALELAVKVGGATNVLYGSDYPHNIGDMKGCRARVEALPPAVRDAVASGNARRIFGL
jgi:aminocarboxymuconate-semialdehyde decarboxylase